MDNKKNNASQKGVNTQSSSNKQGSSRSGKWLITLVCLAVMGWGVWQFTSMASRYDGDPVWVKVPHHASEADVADSIKSALGDDYGSQVLRYLDTQPAKCRGAYQILPDQKAIDIARNIENGRQTPVKLTFNNIRTLDQLDERLTSRMDWEPGEFRKAFEAEAASLGVSPEILLGRMLPDTYEVYWTSDPGTVIQKILKNYEKFWNDERVSKAAALGLTPDQVGIIASIAEEETAKTDERGKVGRLYINRLQKGMKLQADPTVKYAVGDFSIRRVGGAMLDTDSPYNTYRYMGLPPGPIRIPDSQTIKSVLDAPAHDYIYMCAKSDFSGYHDFTSDYATHQRNAAAFRRALDARGIKL
ncbi:MAG: endolytic transglycosylase MltG [Muribaculaceae bacterium]|nr:endolytic transglycosylase MltG [Muribaculaceae bacterium]